MQEPIGSLPVLPGFGTAHLMGRIGMRESTRLVHAALDCGITHFDTARAYGFGDAEWMLGRALRGRPDVLVYTKVGQGRPQHSWLRAQINAAARPPARARARLTGPRSDSARGARGSLRHTNFSVGYVRQSVETSLRMLRRDTLDGLLLHEVTVRDMNPGLVDLMEALIREGKVRRFGVASEPKALSEFAEDNFPGSVLQQAGGPFVKPIELCPPTELVLHSLFGRKADDLHCFESWLNDNVQHKDALSSAIAEDNLSGIPAILISYTSTRWPRARIIFASTSKRRIMENVVAAQHRLSVDSSRVVNVVMDAYSGDTKRGVPC